MGEETMYMIYEARYLLVLVLLLIIIDFNLGRRESSARYEEAKKTGDTYTLNKYRWRTSRALRRSANKFLEYVLYCLMGLFFGMAMLEPLGVQGIWGTYAAVAFIAVCIERKSIFGHMNYLYKSGAELGSLGAFISRFAVIFAKKKNQDVGEALEEALNANKE